MNKQTLFSVCMITGLVLGMATSNADDDYQNYSPESGMQSGIYYDGPYAIHKSDVQFSEKWIKENMQLETGHVYELNSEAETYDEASLDEEVVMDAIESAGVLDQDVS